jgi:hypothetical protein
LRRVANARFFAAIAINFQGIILHMEIPPYETLATLAEHVDDYAVVEHIQALGTPAEVAEAYDQLLRDAYWKHKDLPLAVTLATSGIHYCFAHAKLAGDDATRASFKSQAKTMAFNLASFTWPGWDEPGISITSADRARGLEAAKLNLRLAVELQKPFDKVCAGAWLLGAHLLAAGELDEALFHFRYAVPEAEDANYALYEGYVLLAQILLKEATAHAAWNALLASLHARTDDTAKFARDQLMVAHRVFVRPHPAV